MKPDSVDLPNPQPQKCILTEQQITFGYTYIDKTIQKEVSRFNTKNFSATQIPRLVSRIDSSDYLTQVQGLIGVKKLLNFPTSEKFTQKHIQRIFQVTTQIIEKSSSSQTQFEALCCLTNLTALLSGQKIQTFWKNFCPSVLKFIAQNTQIEIANQAIWLISNLIIDCPKFTEILIETSLAPSLLKYKSLNIEKNNPFYCQIHITKILSIFYRKQKPLNNVSLEHIFHEIVARVKQYYENRFDEIHNLSSHQKYSFQCILWNLCAKQSFKPIEVFKLIDYLFRDQRRGKQVPFKPIIRILHLASFFEDKTISIQLFFGRYKLNGCLFLAQSLFKAQKEGRQEIYEVIHRLITEPQIQQYCSKALQMTYFLEALMKIALKNISHQEKSYILILVSKIILSNQKIVIPLEYVLFTNQVCTFLNSQEPAHILASLQILTFIGSKLTLTEQPSQQSQWCFLPELQGLIRRILFTDLETVRYTAKINILCHHWHGTIARKAAVLKELMIPEVQKDK